MAGRSHTSWAFDGASLSPTARLSPCLSPPEKDSTTTISRALPSLWREFSEGAARCAVTIELAPTYRWTRRGDQGRWPSERCLRPPAPGPPAPGPLESSLSDHLIGSKVVDSLGESFGEPAGNLRESFGEGNPKRSFVYHARKNLWYMATCLYGERSVSLAARCYGNGGRGLSPFATRARLSRKAERGRETRSALASDRASERRLLVGRFSEKERWPSERDLRPPAPGPPAPGPLAPGARRPTKGATRRTSRAPSVFWRSSRLRCGGKSSPSWTGTISFPWL